MVKKMAKKTMAFIILLTVAVLVNARCKQGDIKGVWHDFGLNHTANAIGYCIFRIGSNGAIDGSSVCYNYTATADFPPINVTSGVFNINGTCKISGSLGAVNGVVASFNGQMDRSKNSFTAISRSNAGSIALHNFVKQ